MNWIIHLIEDKKFLNPAINKFSVDDSIFNIFVSIGKYKFSRIGSGILVSLPTFVINSLIPLIHFLVRAIVIHGFSSSFFNIKFENLHSKVKVLGIFWGFDLYSIKGSKVDYLMKETKEFVRENHGFSNKFGQSKFIEFVGQRINYVSTVVPTEREILETHFPKAKFRFTWFSYFDLENDVLNGIQSKQLNFSGQNLLFGNNSSLWNNHIDGIEAIKSFKFKFDEIICPLSYSGSEHYKLRVIECLSNEFINKFKPITSFLDYSEYLNILLSCQYVFFNSKRQIGLGNLLFSIYLGSVVILNKSNPLYNFFLLNGIKVFSIEDAQTNTNFDIDIIRNRKSLERLFNEKVVKERTLHIIQNLISE